MGDGIRIRPQAARLAELPEDQRDPSYRLVILRDTARPKPGPPYIKCDRCGEHRFSTYHLQLDGEGTVIVSPAVWQRLLAMPDHGGFEMVNVVREPPAQGLILPTAHARPQAGNQNLTHGR